MDISLVVPLLNEEESLQELHDWIAKVMQSNRFSYELLFIDDGSSDGSWNKIMDLAKINPWVMSLLPWMLTYKTALTKYLIYFI